METIKQIRQVAEVFNFSWGEAFSDPNGKTSMSYIGGFILIVVGSIAFLWGGFTKQSDLVIQSVIVIGLGAAMITGSKIMNGKPLLEDRLPEEIKKEKGIE